MSSVTTEGTVEQKPRELPGMSDKKKLRQVQRSVAGFEPIPKKSAVIRTDKPRPHVCSTCTRAFARLEHLKRHERSHTNEKPFQCAACGRCFARRDLVLRHQQKLHSSLVNSSTTSTSSAASTRKNDNEHIITNFGNKEVSLPTRAFSSDPHGQTSQHGGPGSSTGSRQRQQKQQLHQRSSVESYTSSSGGSLFSHTQKRNRHNSFSAASAGSYMKTTNAESGSTLSSAVPGSAGATLTADTNGGVPSTEEMPEAPHQVGFATPQLTATELASKALMSGFDLSALGLSDPIEELNLSSNNSSSNHYFSPRTSNDQLTRSNTPYQFNITPGGSLIDMPILNEYLHLGGAGGGAGFTYKNNSSTMSAETDSTPEDWLYEFINTPFEQDFNSNFMTKDFNSIGFPSSISPTNSSTSIPSIVNSTNNKSTSLNPSDPHKLFNHDISSLFRSRQIHLFKQVISKNNFKSTNHYFTEALRDEIIQLNDLSNEKFPSLDELNSYISLYTQEFNKYFPFIHLQTLIPNKDNYPLVLIISSIGALYGFHSTHAMLLFNITRFRIHEYLENEKFFKKNSNIPLWVYQSMVLLVFIGIFNNDSKITETMTLFLNSLIELIKLTGLNLPLENFINPPSPPSTSPISDISNSNKKRKLDETINDSLKAEFFEYFILAQSRIRTCHTVLLISSLFSSLIGLDCSLHSIDLKCGIHCKNEILWQSSNGIEWFKILNNEIHYKIDSKFSLIELSNGNDNYNNCLNYLTLNNFILQKDFLMKHYPMDTLLSLLMSIHEKIYLERDHLKNESNGIIRATKWRMNSRPIIETLLKSWESLFVKNGGVLYLSETSTQSNDKELKSIKNPILKLILPLLSLAKIRKCIHLTPIIEYCWKKNWDKMNESLNELNNQDPEALKEAANYALDIIRLWIDFVSVIHNAEKTSMRTPIFFITCIFTSLLVIAEFLNSIEVWSLDESNNYFLNAIDRSLWLKSEILFKKIESLLLKPNNTYSESLRLEAKGALDVEIINDDLAKIAMNPNTDINETKKIVKNARLASRGLYLGVRILGDAPIWPIALLFAQALKKRAIFIQNKSS